MQLLQSIHLFTSPTTCLSVCSVYLCAAEGRRVATGKTCGISLTGVKSRRSGSRLLPSPLVAAVPRSCPLAFHTFAYHLLGGVKGGGGGGGAGSKSVGVPVLLIAGRHLPRRIQLPTTCHLPLATFHLQLATGNW